MASVSWTATTSGSWNNATNWSNGVGPQNGDDVTINPSGSSITVTYGTGTLNLDSLVTGAGDTLDVTGGQLATQGNGYRIGGDLIIGGGTLRLVGGGNQGNTIGADLTQTGGTLAFVNDAVLQGGILKQSAGTMSIAHGVLLDQDAGTIGGTISGAGEFQISNNGTTVLASGAVISTGALVVAQGTLFLQEKLTYANRFSLAGTLDLNGNVVTLSGHDALDGDVNSGTLNLTGSGHLNQLTLENGAFLNIASTINQTGDIQLGGNTGTGTLNIAAGAALRITGNSGINQGSNAGILINKGTLEKIGGGGIAGQTQIHDAITSTGTIDAAVGTINFVGPNSGAQSTITGAITGAGTVEFSNGSTTLGGTKTSLTVDSHRLILSGGTSSTNITLASALNYAGNWEQTGGLLLLQNDLTLTGIAAFDGGELKGTATITDTGPLTLGNGVQLEGNLSFLLNGPVDQTGAVNFGDISDSVDQATLSAGNIWALEGSASINGAFGTITNQGTFVKETGAQNANVASQILNTGTMLVDSGTLSLSGLGTLGGTVGGPGVLDISGQFAFASGLALSVGEFILDQQNSAGQVSLASNLTFANVYAQEGGTLALNGHTLTLSGVTSLDTGAILGSGEVVVAGQAVINNVALAQGCQVQFNGATEQIGNVTLTGGSTAPTLSIGGHGIYTIENGLSIGGANGSVLGTVAVAGTLVASGAGTTTLAATVQDGGVIAISHGQMQFLGPLTGGGIVSLSAGGMLALDTNAATSTGVTFGAGGGLLDLQNPGGYGGTIGGFASGDSVELNGFAFSTNGTLAAISASGDTVTITEPGSGPSVTLTFSSAQSIGSLTLGLGPHGGLALIHI
jgi:fibronectin-binding autotransporter adhesin